MIRPCNCHVMKLKPPYFDDVLSGKKNFEIRKNDRGFSVGDHLVLREYRLGKYTGRLIEKDVTYIYDGNIGLEPGYVILGIQDGNKLEKKSLEALLKGE